MSHIYNQYSESSFVGQPPPETIKLIAVDIDGTLLNPQRQITRRTRAAIQAAYQEGIVVVLATARGHRSSAHLAKELEIPMPLITCDGALIIQYPDRHILHTQLLEASVAQQAANLLLKHGIQPVIHQICGQEEETWCSYSHLDNPELSAYLAVFPATRRLAPEELCIGQPDPIRVVGFASQERIQQLLPEADKLECERYWIHEGNYGCAEIIFLNGECSKASGLQALAQHLHIPTGQIMAIGDNFNDKEMLEMAGWGVAMGQAPDQIKMVAQAITSSNARDGVAEAIETYALRRDRFSAR